MLSVVEFRNPLFWGLFVGWVLSVILHEFAHGLVAYLGGDHTVKERGGLTLNPLRYVDPLMTIGLPIVFMLIGGIPLPGGSTSVRRDLLRSRAWDVAVSAAGPATNLLLFLGLAAALNPRAGWVDYTEPVSQWPPEKIFVAALAFFQLLATLLNLIPIPPLDGFQMVSPFLSEGLRQRLTRPPIGMVLLIGFFVLVNSERFFLLIYRVMDPITRWVGIDLATLLTAARVTLYGHP